MRNWAVRGEKVEDYAQQKKRSLRENESTLGFAEVLLNFETRNDEIS